ncbi:hypothetical protein GGI19_003897 [Coemansia pectinata]|uniref:Uncharacterized protein n=1 Tax=Coemansia pectinata TaxID=1052879 RepID=A0A9W8GZS1_9FUNG|nr:hypothetical protein GGI19_003897 [Coemansia pectinata]
MNNNNAHQGPALSQAEQLEAMLEVAHRLSVEKRHIVTERDRVVAQHEHTIADRDPSGSGDALDEASSGTDDDDLDDAASGTAEDILDDTASRANDALDDQTAESYHAAKRRRLNQQVRDVLGEEVTRQRLLEVACPFTIIDVGVLARIYELVIRRPLIPAGVDLGKLAQKLARLEGLTRWPPRRAKADPPELATMYLLRFSDMDHDTPRQTQLHRLGLAEVQGAVVLGPRLCYVLVSMGGIRLKHMSGAILDRMFRSITKKRLGELTVVTKDFVGRMTADKLCRLVKAWVRKLRKFIVEGRIERLQEAMAQCNDRYKGQCPMGANGAHSDPTGEVAKRVLKQSSDCRLLLGLDDAQKLIALCKRFFATVGDDVDQRTAAHLRQIADS